MPDKPQPPPSDQITELPRRGLLTSAAAAVVGALVGVVPMIASAIFFLDPLSRQKKAVGATGDAIDAEGFIKVASRSALPISNTPGRKNDASLFKVVADLQDYWNKFPDSEIGAVYLREQANGEIQCFNARCPHLGCTVNYDNTKQEYFCPCHLSAFSLDGERTNQIPPRNMDTLETKDKNGDIWVEFIKFRAGIEKKRRV